MYKLATQPQYHEELVSYGLQRYVSSGTFDGFDALCGVKALSIEYRRASQGSPLAYEDDPSMVLRPRSTLLSDMIKSTLEDLPLVSSFHSICPTRSTTLKSGRPDIFCPMLREESQVILPFHTGSPYQDESNDADGVFIARLSECPALALCPWGEEAVRRS